MNISNSSSNQRLIPRWLLVVAVIVAIIGFFDATYLTIQGLSNAVPPCAVGDCEQVLTSKFAYVGSVPIAAFGILYYAAVILLLVLFMATQQSRPLRWFWYLSIAGFAASVWLVFAQAVLLKAFCQYCLLSAATSTALFAIGIKTRRI